MVWYKFPKRNTLSPSPIIYGVRVMANSEDVLLSLSLIMEKVFQILLVVKSLSNLKEINLSQ